MTSSTVSHRCLAASAAYSGPLTVLVGGEGGLGVLSQDPAARLFPILAPGLTPPGAPGCTGSLVLCPSLDASTVGGDTPHELVLVLLPELTDEQGLAALNAGESLDVRFELLGRLVAAQLIPQL